MNQDRENLDIWDNNSYINNCIDQYNISAIIYWRFAANFYTNHANLYIYKNISKAMLKKSFRKLDCLFCNIYQRKEFIILENRFFYSQFDRFPVSPGHAEVIPNYHIESLTSLNNMSWRYLK